MPSTTRDSSASARVGQSLPGRRDPPRQWPERVVEVSWVGGQALRNQAGGPATYEVSDGYAKTIHLPPLPLTAVRSRAQT